MSRSVFHEGERAVQVRAGVAAMAERLGNGIHDAMPPAAQEFMERQPFAVLSMTDADGDVWPSPLTGEPGFLQAVTPRTARVNALPAPGDPLRHRLASVSPGETPQAGLLVIEAATRKRMRVNGVLLPPADGDTRDGFTLHVEEAYANCPKYIQARTLTENSDNTGKATNGKTIHENHMLTDAQQAAIACADTFFIATTHPSGGADASHRGGNRGFVRVVDGQTLAFPDYAGNNMFNTLGNLAVNPRAGLLFVDFETGDTLQLTGEAAVNWDAEFVATFAGAQRVVEFHVRRVVQIDGAVPLRWQFASYSPFNPKQP